MRKSLPALNSLSVDKRVEAVIAQIAKAPIAELRQRWREVFRTDPPKAFGPDLLKRSIAYRIQEKAYGGLSKTTTRQLEKIARALTAKPDTPVELPRRIKRGSELVRTWKGTVHKVVVLEDGFAYQGKPFASLSEIATEITGTRWNGPRFFGLRKSTGPSASSKGANRAR